MYLTYTKQIEENCLNNENSCWKICYSRILLVTLDKHNHVHAFVVVSVRA